MRSAEWRRVVTEARTGRLRPRAGVGASASRRLRGRNLRGEGARAAAAAERAGGPGRLTFVAHSSKSGVIQFPPGVPGAVAGTDPSGSVRIALLLINTVFWSGTCFVSVSAAPLPGRRLYIKESMKKSLLQKKRCSYPHEDMDNSAPDWGSSRGDLKNCTFWFENPAPGKSRSVRGVRTRAFRAGCGDTLEFFSLRRRELRSRAGPGLFLGPQPRRVFSVMKSLLLL